MPKFNRIMRYDIATISDSSEGPLVSVGLYLQKRLGDDQTYDIELGLDPPLAKEMAEKILLAAKSMVH